MGGEGGSRLNEQPHLAITTLGDVDVKFNGNRANLGTRKTTALLIYLACNQGPIGRDKLAALFWHEVPEENARASLSVALSHLRKALPEWIVATRSTVELNSRMPLSLDVKTLAKEWHEWRAAHAAPATATGQSLERLDQIIACYQGGFLDGLTIDASASFEEWVWFERERLEQIAVQALEVLANAALHRGNYRRGISQARRLLRLDPFRESAHELLMRLLARTGQRGAALAHFESCRRLFEEELAVSPGRDLQRLYERLAVEPPAQSLPTRPVFTAGRSKTMRRIRRRLLDPGCRLMTITGSGGSGKTHLALEIGWSLREAFLNGVCFFSVPSVKSTGEFLRALAITLGLEPQGEESLREQLFSYLRNMELLLVLDGLDPFLPGAGVLADVIDRAPYVRVLVTSRESLALREPWAWHVPLDGLSYPQREPETQATLVQLSLQYSAIALFRREARRLGIGIADVPSERAAITRICHLVNGLPLGLQLAAAWLPALSCEEIAAKLTQRLDLLVIHQDDRSAAARSLATVVAHSLSALTSTQRHAYLQLSVFQGNFDAAAAREVAGAELALLLALVEKSVVRRAADVEANSGSDPHYVLPQLLQQHARHELRKEPEHEAQTLARHAAYFMTYVQERKNALLGPEQQQALRQIDRVFPDIRHGWDYAVVQLDQMRVGQAVEGLAEYYYQRGLYEEGNTIFRDAGAQFEAAENAGVIEARLLAWQAVFMAASGARARAEGLLRSSLALLRAEKDETRQDQAFVYLQLSRHAADVDLEESARLCERAISLYQASGETRGLALAVGQMADIKERCGEPDSAERLYAASVYYLERCGDWRSAADVLGAWANAAASEGQIAHAEELARRAHTLYQGLESRISQTNVLQQLGLLLMRQGKWNEALILLEESLAAYQELGYRRRQSRAHSMLALALAHSGGYEDAARHSERALALAIEMQDQASEGYALSVSGWISMAKGEFWRARQQLEKSVLVYHGLGERVGLSHSLAALAIADIRLRNLAAGKGHLIPALEFARETRYPFSALVAVAVATLLLQASGALERAVQLTSVARGDVALARSSLINACILKPVEVAAESLSPAALMAAREVGETLELWTTVDALLEELSAPAEVALELGKLAFSAASPSGVKEQLVWPH